MKTTPTHIDMLVIGSGPAGKNAAIQGAKAGKQVVLIEREAAVGGACIHKGTIPSKTLRESALNMVRFQRTNQVIDFKLRDDIRIASFMERLDHVITAHSEFMNTQLTRNGITRYHGQARFLSDREIVMTARNGSTQRFTADTIIIATGSRPRTPEHIAVDHEHILDADSILSLIYLPKSLTVLGGGVIASEYASFFSLLGVKVTMVDQADRPLRFLDPDMVQGFLQAFQKSGGVYHGSQPVTEAKWDGLSKVLTVLRSGEILESEKLLVALGRVANLEKLDLHAAGISPTDRGVLPVNEFCQTIVPHIYAVGDVIGAPSLASCSMEQGRRAACHALGLDPGHPPDMIPMGIYTVPEIASVGLDEEAATRQFGAAIVGQARFTEIARGQISGMTDGLLKMVASPDGKTLLGVQIVGEGATEIIHIGQLGLINQMNIDSFVENIFNFPTLAEAYRVAALDIVKQRG